MPGASATKAPQAHARARARALGGARGARPAARRPAAGVRWDRLGGLALLLVGAALLYLYLSAGIRMLSTWNQARYDSTTVAALEHEHVQLEHQHEILSRRGTLEEDARQLGMIKPNEQSYVVTGLPGN